MVAQIFLKEKRGRVDSLKSGLRREMLAKRAEYPAEKKALGELDAGACLIRSPLWRKARRIALFYPLPQEFSTIPLIKAAREAGKIALLPKILDKKERRMDFFPWSEGDGLVPGPFGLMEPAAGAPQIPDAVVLPGLAFDLRGFRLGYGGGYYDRWLSAHSPAIPTIGLCLDYQILDSVPCAGHDARARCLCSPRGMRLL